MSLNVYLHFNDTCRQAFEFYRSIFGGEFDLITTFGEGPPEFTVPEDERDNVMHVSYRIGDMVLMGSDTPSTFGPPTIMGNNFSLSYVPNSKEEVDERSRRPSAHERRNSFRPKVYEPSRNWATPPGYEQ